MENQYPNSAVAKNLSQTRLLIPSSFALAIFFFFFTFCDFKCNANQQKVGSVTGINLVTGTEFKSTTSEPSMNTDLGFGRDWNPNKAVKKKENIQKIPANIWAILAILAALIGCGSFLLKAVKENLIGIGSGLVAAVSLIALQLSFKSEIESQSKGQVEAIFQFAYWASLILVSVAGVLSYLRLKNTERDMDVKTNDDLTKETGLFDSIEVQTSVNPSMAKETTDILLLSPKNLKVIALIASGMILLGFIFPWFDLKSQEFENVNDGVKLLKFFYQKKSNGDSVGINQIFLTCLLPIASSLLLWNRAKNGNKKIQVFISSLLGLLAIVLLLIHSAIVNNKKITPIVEWIILPYRNSNGDDLRFFGAWVNSSNGLGVGAFLMLTGIFVLFIESLIFLYNTHKSEENVKDAILKSLFAGSVFFVIGTLLYFLTKDSITLSEKYYHLLGAICTYIGIFLHQRTINQKLTYGRVILIGVIAMAFEGLLLFFRSSILMANTQTETSTGVLMLSFICYNSLWGFLYALIIGFFYSTPEIPIFEKIQTYFYNNKKTLLGLAGSLILGIFIYPFVFSFNPKKEAEKVAIQYCELQKEGIGVGIEMKNKLITSMTDESKAQSYRDEYNLIYQKIQTYTLKGDSIYQSSFSKADDDSRYKFQEAYNLLIENCNKDIKAQLKKVDSLFEAKMNAFQIANERKMQENSPYSLVSVLKSPNCYLELATKVLNIRDVPSKNSGNVVGQIKQGFAITQFYSANQQIDERGVPWYYITNEGVNGWISGLYCNIAGVFAYVQVSQAPYYNLEESTMTFSQRSDFIKYEDSVRVLKYVGEYVFVSYNGTEGWMKMSDLKTP